MSEPTRVALEEMGLLSKSPTIQTTIIGIADQQRRKIILEKFTYRYKDDTEMCNVLWSADDNLKEAPSRCNGNLVLIALGAKVNQNGDQPAIEIPNVYILPREAIGNWSKKHLKVTHSHYKGHDRVLLAEPAKYEIPRFFDYVPKLVFESVGAEVAKFVEEFKDAHPGLTAGHVKVRYILMRCNLGLGNRGDVEDHTLFAHGVDINSLEIMPTIKVIDGEKLVLATALNLKNMSKESRFGIYKCWFNAAIANGTVTMLENKANAKINKHKAEDLLKVIPEMYNKIFYHLKSSVEDGVTHDISLGFTCKWELLVTACEDALGPMADVKRARNYINGKDHLKGGISLHNSLNRVNNIVEDSFGKADVVSKLDDGTEISNRAVKEYEKFRLAFEISEALPVDYDRTREDLVTGLSKNMYNPSKTFKAWVTEIEKTISTKGNSVLFKDKMLPQLTQAKFSNNSAGILSSENRNKFMELWSKVEVKEEEDNKRRKEILEAIESKITALENSKTPVFEIKEVKKIAGNTRLCWGCLSHICWSRTRMSLKTIGKKLTNRHCPVKKILLGDPNLTRLLRGRVGKNNFVSVDDINKSEGASGPGKQFKKKQVSSMSVVKPVDPEPQIKKEVKRVNLTGVPDDELFAPAWLCKDQEIFVEKRVIPTYTNKKWIFFSG